jgi:two-component system, cell cycle sensor histidine kinase and response regulator CckA
MEENQLKREPSAQEMLRVRAEKQIRMANSRAAPLSNEDLRTALEELEIYRAELEIQNEELRLGRVLLEETQKRYFRHFDLAPVGLVRLDSGGLVLEANILGAAMLGVNRELLHRSRQPFLTRVAADSRATFQQHFEQALASGQMEACELTLRAARGAETFVRMQGVRNIGEADTPELYVTLTDLTERRRIEQALQESEARAGAERERLAEVLESISDIFYALDADWHFTYMNRKAEEVLGHGRQELLGRSYWDEFPAALGSEAYDMHLKAMSERRAVHYETLSPVLQRWISVSIYPRQRGGFSVHLRDISEQKLLEAQLRQSHKMEAIGLLAGGVAHDFNNLLSVIFGHCELLERALLPKNALSASVSEILGASNRAAALTRQLLAFSRRQVLAPVVVDLNAIVTEAETLLRRLIGEDVRLVTVLRPDLNPVRVDPGQIDQVILNLAVNARNAMVHGGTLTLETSEVEGESTDGEVPPGAYNLLTVRDTGTGMMPELQAQIFEPFFTTRGAGEGTGLGLSVVDGIVKQSGGYITVDSAPGKGTRFKIYLPTVDEPLAVPAPSAPSKPGGGSETVLLTEDEEPVRVITALMLETLGYRVLQAANGEEALLLAEKCREKIDLLMTDVVMPGMSGRGLADALRARDPGLKVLFHSGYTADAVVRRGVVQAEMAFLQKPFTPQALARKIRQVLDRS